MAASLGSASASATLDVGSFLGNADKAIAKMGQFDAAAGKAGKGAGFFQKAMATGAGFLGATWIDQGIRSLANFGKAAIATGIDFEAQMSAVGAVSGATGDQLQALTDKALQIGKDTAFGATEAAVAIEELAKAGLSVTQILGGAADSTAALAAAGGIDMPAAASVMTAAMNQFGIAAEDSMMVADLLAAASATSAVDVLDLGESLRYVGTQASAMGYDIQTITTALAIMGDQGLKGSMAGTSLNQMLLNMANPTKKARAAMDELGISFADINGNMRPLPDIISDVATATAGMGDATRAAYLETLFGVEGGRAMNALLTSQTDAAKAAGKGWEDYYAGVTKSGVAAEQAKARMDNVRGSIEQLKGGMETLAILGFSAVAPMLRTVTDGMGGIVDGAIEAVSRFQALRSSGLSPLQAAMVTLNGVLIKTFGPKVAKKVMGFVRDVVAGLQAAAGLIGDVAGLIRKTLGKAFDFLIDHGEDVIAALKGIGIAIAGLLAIGAVIGIVAAVGGALALLLSPIGLLIAAAALLGIAWDRNFLGMRDTITDFGGTVLDTFGHFMEAFDHFSSQGLNPVQAGLRALGLMFPQIAGLAGTLQIVIGQLTEAFHSFMEGDFGAAFDSIRDAAQTAFDALSGLVGRVWDWTLDVAVPTVTGWIVTAAGNVWGALKTAAGWVWDNRADIGTVTLDIAGWALGKVEDVWEFIKGKILGGDAGLSGDGTGGATPAMPIDIGEVVVDIGSWAKGTVADLWPYIQDWASTAASGIFGAAGTLFDVAVNIGSWAKGTIADLWPYVTEWASSAASGIFGAAGTLYDLLVNIGSWAKGTIADLWPYIQTWATSAISGVFGAAGTFYDVAVNIGSWAAGEIASLGDWLATQIGLQDFTPVGNTAAAKVMAAISTAFSAGEAVGGATGGIFNIGTSILNWINRQMEGIEFDAVGERVGNALAAAVAAAVSGGAAFDIVGRAFTIGLLSSINDEMGESGFTDAFWRLFDNIGEAGGEAFEGVAEGFLNGLVSAIAPDGTVTLPGGFTFDIPTIEFDDALADAFKDAFINAAMPGSTLDVGDLEIAIGDITFGDIADAFKTALINAAIPGGTLTLDILNIDILGGDDDNKGDDTVSDDDDDGGGAGGGTLARTRDLGNLARLLSDVTDRASAARDAIGGLFGGGGGRGIGGAGAGAGPDASGLIGSLDTVKSSLTNLTTLATTVSLAMDGLVISIANGMALATSVMSVLLGTLVADVANSFAIITGGVSTFMGEFVATIANSMVLASGVVSSLAGTIVATFANSFALISGVVSEFMGEVIATIANSMVVASGVVSDLAGSMVATFANSFAIIAGVVESGMGDVIAAVANGMETAAATVEGYAGILYGAGQDAMTGLAGGVRSGYGDLQAAVNGAIAIMGQIPKLGNSPWPMMIGAGKDAMDGLRIGWERRYGALAATVADTIELFTFAPTSSPTSAFAFASPPSSGGYGGGNNTYHVTTNVDADGITDPEVVAELAAKRTMQVLVALEQGAS